ncbi:hypothetical protein GQ44DRAFT_717234 [Phaeosphaeriaceae sp. PMI808]|nr:hypothetical protein GQ44DRAFT_717234 [Phaeosphaeriaceae sp. PMI808]
MSFGFSVGDFVTLSTFAYKIYHACKTSSSDFGSIASEVQSLHVVLDDMTQHLTKNSVDNKGAEQLEHLKENCYGVLSEIEKQLKKYGSLGTKKQRFLHKMGWALNDVSSIRSRLILYIGMLTALNTNLIKASQARVEKNFAEFMCTTIAPSAHTSNPCLPNTASGDVIVDSALETVNRTPSLLLAIEEHDSQLSHVNTISHPINGGSNPDHKMRREGTAKQLNTGASVHSMGIDSTPTANSSLARSESNHIYQGVVSAENGAQINGDIGSPTSQINRSHTYNCVIARGNGRQINGNIHDLNFFREFLKA